MIAFRDEGPTYEEAATAVAEAFEELDSLGRCRVCGNVEDDCNRYREWCIGRSCRLSKTNPGWRAQVVEQLEMVVSRHDCWPRGSER